MLHRGDDLAHRFRNRAALFSLRAETGFAPVPELRFYAEVSGLYQAMALAAEELNRLNALLSRIERELT